MVNLDKETAKKGGELVEKVAKRVETSESASDTIAKMAYKIRSPKLQAMFDWFSDDTKAELLRADDRNFIMKFVEKFLPGADPRMLNIPKQQLSNFFSFLVTFGAVDAPEEMIAKMRGRPGLGILSIPDPVLTLILKLLEIPAELVMPVIKAIKSVGNTSDVLAPKVRAKVHEMLEAGEVTANTQEFETEETKAAGIQKS